MPAKTTRVFIDTNVWFSSFYGSKNCQTLTNAHQNEKIVAVVSNFVIKELVKNIKKKIPDNFDNLQRFFINNPPEIIADPQNIPDKLVDLVSPGDITIFVSAVNAKVKYFVTGNSKHFAVKKLEKLTGIKILTPKQAVSMLYL